MYTLPPYVEKNEDVVKTFIDQHPFAFITGIDTDMQPVATQIPVFIEEQDGRKILRGHLMRNTDHHKAFMHSPNVLVVFTSPHVYVSATWYSDPHQASTWNYISVHVKGIIRFLAPEALPDVLRKVTLHFENYNSESSTIFDNLSPSYTEGLMKAIVAFEIEIKEINNVFKLSQNRDAKSFQNIIEKLKEQGHDGQYIAAEMEKRKIELYPEDFIS